MKRVLPPAEFRGWMESFLPEPGSLAEPPIVFDHADAKHSHLDGLCLSRAWCFAQLGLPGARREAPGGGIAARRGRALQRRALARQSFATLALSAEARKTP